MTVFADIPIEYLKQSIIIGSEVIMILFWKEIKELRNKYKYTQTELANLVGVTKSTIAAYENDTRQP